MDWNDLRYFLAVTQGGSLSAAAAQLGVSPSTVSRRIETMERDLKTRLFDPHRDGYSLTPAGQDLVPDAERAAAQFHQFERSALGAGSKTVTVRVEAPELLAQDMLLPALAPFMAACPDVRIELRGAVRPVRLAAEEADLILRLVRPEQGDYRLRKLGQIGFGLYASSTHAEAAGIPQRGEDLRRHRLIGWPNDFGFLLMARWLDMLCPGLEPHLRLTTLSAQLAAARQGLGWAILPDFAARPADLVRAMPDGAALASDLWLLTLRRSAESDIVRAVQSRLIDAARGL